MIKRLVNIFLFLWILALVISCSTNNDSYKLPEHLIVKVDEALVMNNPDSMKKQFLLFQDYEAKVLKRGKKENINGIDDYWYKIEFRAMEGWIFGAQTNLAKNEVYENECFIAFFSRFLCDSYQGNNLKSYIHPKINFYWATNPGAYCQLENIKSVANKTLQTKQIPAIFHRPPEGNYCLGYHNEASGFYIEEMNVRELDEPHTWFEGYKYNSEKRIELVKSISPMQPRKVTVVIEEEFNRALYFVNINYQWYVIIEDFCDCSA